METIAVAAISALAVIGQAFISRGKAERAVKHAQAASAQVATSNGHTLANIVETMSLDVRRLQYGQDKLTRSVDSMQRGQRRQSVTLRQQTDLLEAHIKGHR